LRVNKLLTIGGIIICIGLVGVIVWELLFGLTYSAVPRMAGKDQSVQVFIVKPVFNSKVQVKQPVSVYAEAVGLLDIQKMDLWVDNHLWNVGASDIKPANKATAGWQWTPLEEGVYTLMVRATDVEGKASNSNPIQVKVVAEAPLSITGQSIDEVDSFTPQDLSQLSPPEDGLSGGEIPIPPPFPPDEQPPEENDTGQPAENWIPIKYDLVFHDFADKILGNPEPPTAPKVFGKSNGCDAQLTIQDLADNESGFVIERKDPGGMEFKQIAILDARVGTGTFNYLDTGTGFGKYLYAAYAINSAGKSMGNIVAIDIADLKCLQPEQTSLGIIDAKIVPGKPVGNMYCYMSVDGASWVRIPPKPDTFISGINGAFDFSPYLGNLMLNPPPGSITIYLDCWGWNGDTLEYLGSIQKKIDSGIIELNGNAFKFLGEAKKQYLMDGEGDFPPGPHIPAPTNFRFAQNESDCAKIPIDPQDPTDMAAWCKMAVQLNMHPAIWDWEPNAGSPCDSKDTVCQDWWKKGLETDIDGYNLYYRWFNDLPTKIKSYGYPTLKFAFIEPVPDNGHLKANYLVRAYKGNLESGDSNDINLETTPGTLHNIKLMQLFHTYSASGIPLGQSVPTDNNDKEPVGYTWDGNHSNNGYVDDLTVQFDILSDYGLTKAADGPFTDKVSRATLFWSYIDRYGAGSGLSLFPDGCRNTLWDRNGQIYGYYLNGIEGYDVTPQIRQMNAERRRVVEFFLKSGRRTPVDLISANSCIEYYGKFHMEIVVFE
jgi:hypothetical protein